MRKFKLIKTYPGSPNLGEILIGNKENDRFHPTEKCMENNPEFWQEVKEEFPKIISFRLKGFEDGIRYINKYGKFPSVYKEEAFNSTCNQFSGEALLKNGWYEIYEVAVSETGVFKLGDLVNNPKLQRPMPFIISKFYFNCNNEHILCNGECCGNGHVSVMKVEHYTKPEPLLITIDGFEVFECDYVYWVREDNSLGESHYHKTIHTKEGYKNLKYFKNKEAAKKYILENKLIYSKKQIEEALLNSKEANPIATVDEGFIIISKFNENKFKQKLNL